MATESLVARVTVEPDEFLLVDAEAIDVEQLAGSKAVVTNRPIYIVAAIVRPGMSLKDTLRTCDLATLKRVVADMEATG